MGFFKAMNHKVEIAPPNPRWDMMKAKICQNYIANKSKKKYISIMIPFLILIINYFLKKNAIISVKLLKIDRKSIQISVL